MASLQLKENTLDEKSHDTVENKTLENTSTRTLRKRTFSDKALLLTNPFKRQRVNLKSPDKLNSEKDVVDYYIKVNKNWRVKQTNLETIFEEPKESSDGNVVTMSGSKVRRSIAFSGRVTKAKKVKRNAKVKKFQLCKGKSVEEKKRKLTMDEVKLRLAALESWPAILTEIGEEAQFSNI